MEIPPESPRNEGELTDTRTLISFYSNQVLRRFICSIPFRDSSLFAKISNIFLGSPARSWRCKPGLPLPLPPSLIDPTSISSEASRVFDVLEDITDHILSSLHGVQKNLQFWQCRAELLRECFERGPLAFIDGTVQLLRECFMEGSSLQHICHSAAAQISERVAILTNLQHCLAAFLAQIYMEVDKFGQYLIKDPEKSLPSLMVSIDSFFSKLEASIVHSNSVYQRDSSVSLDSDNSCSPLFDKLPEINHEGSQWTDCQIRSTINLIYQNLHKLDAYLSFVVAKHRKPRRMALYWFRYTCGAVGLSVCSVWLLRHSRLMGSSDIDNWIREARESTIGFWNDHVEQPLLSIRDELFETFRRRHKGVMEIEEVQLTASSLHRMLLAFTEQQRGQKLPEEASDQEMLEVVMVRYEKDLMHPIQNLLGGDIARALLIQIQKLKLDIETAMLELDQILKANEINFAILAALPAFFLSLILLMLVRAWFKQDKGAEGRGRIAQLQRRLLLVEVEKKIMSFQTYVDQGQEEEAQCMFGLVLYSLDRLYKAVERHAKATGEWLSLRQDIIDLGKPGLPTAYKLTVTLRMERVYECLLPSLRSPTGFLAIELVRTVHTKNNNLSRSLATVARAQQRRIVSDFNLLLRVCITQLLLLHTEIELTERYGKKKEMVFGQVVIGPPGSGKTTYCNGMSQFLKLVGRKVAVINLDPANDALPYECAVNIEDLVKLGDVMIEHSLGPNGGLVYCMDYLEKNIDWLQAKLAPFLQDHYLLFDFPGQVELFSLHSNVKNVINRLIKKLNLRLTAVHLVDAHLCSDPGKYVSALLLSLSTMLHLELPHINVLSKIDLIESYGKLAFNLDFYMDVQDLSYLQCHLDQDPRHAKYRKLTKELCEVVENYGLVNFTTLDIQDKISVANLVKLIDKSNGYIFAGIEGSAVEYSKIAAGPLDWDYYRVAAVQEKYMKDDENLE